MSHSVRLSMGQPSTKIPSVPKSPWRSRVDVVARDLFRLARDDAWSQDRAAEQLRAKVHGDVALLRSLRARIARARLQRPSDLAARAAATVELALERQADARRSSVPKQRRASS